MSLLSARFQTIFNVAVAVIFVISLIALPDDMGTWWERLQDIGGMMQDNPLAAVALGASIVLLVLGNLQWLQRVIGMKRWSSDEELGNELHDWLRRARYTITEEPPPPELRNMSFFFVAEQFERKTTILKPSDAPALYIRGRVLPTGEDASTITKMDSAAMTSMIDDIALELARYGVGFKATPNILDEGILVLQLLAFDDSLSPSEFLNSVKTVERAIMLVQMVIARHLRQSQMASGETVIPVSQSTPDTASLQPE